MEEQALEILNNLNEAMKNEIQTKIIDKGLKEGILSNPFISLRITYIEGYIEEDENLTERLGFSFPDYRIIMAIPKSFHDALNLDIVNSRVS